MSSSRFSLCRSVPAMCILAIVLTGCGHEPVRRVPDRGAELTKSRVPAGPVRRAPGEYAAVAAVGQVGTPYVYGGSTVRGFDCSGLVQFAWQRAGRSIPRTTGEQWRRLKVIFPPTILTHSTDQTFYFDTSGLLRRHDYTAEVFGSWAHAAHYSWGHREFDGLIIPTQRQVFPIKKDGKPLRLFTLVRIEISQVKLTYSDERETAA